MTEETLVVNLRGLDCTTFVENVLAFGQTLKKEQVSFQDFSENLKTIRYRDGELNGYPSRLHYFTEWIRNNEQKGLVMDITSELGGEEHKKAVNFMGTHRSLYPFLSTDENYECHIGGRKKTWLMKVYAFYHRMKLKQRNKMIQSGDIIALATSIRGLDVTHTGIAIHQSDGRLHLLHASSKNGEVEVTQQPLVDYLKGIKHNIGIIVARPTLFSP